MTAWSPLLTGPLAARSREVAADVAEALWRHVAPDGTATAEPDADGEVDASLATGLGGLAIAFDYLGETGVVPDGARRAEALLDLATDRMASVEMEPSLLGGFSGIGWVASRLLCPGSREDDALAGLDGEVASALEETPWTRPYDLVSGLVGIGIYALERMPRPAAARALSLVVDRLAETAERTGTAVTWLTPPSLLTGHQLKSSPDGHHDLGLAHGVPGVIGLLGQVVAAGVRVDDARRLLSGAVEWLLLQADPGAARFGYWKGPGVTERPGRTAWCYGDPGVASALLLAARGAGEPAWEREGLDLARLAAARPADQGGVVDAGLCHGTAGLGHIFNRLHQSTGDASLGRAATDWLERTLARRRTGVGLGGYTTATRTLDGGLAYGADPTVLTGVAGIAMALAAATSDVAPAWDRVLLLSSVAEPTR